MMLPVIIYTCSGMIYLIYTIWSIVSLQRYGYETIEVIVGNKEELEFFKKFFPKIPCNIIKTDTKGYPDFSYKPFALLKYMEKYGIQHKNRDIVICDADVIWKKDPDALFKRFQNKYWFHKITSVDPADFDKDISEVPKSNIGLITSLNYEKRYGLEMYPNFRLNAGLFMVPETMFEKIIKVWIDYILRLPRDEMLMSEALLSHVYVDLGLTPISDNVKYHGMEHHKATKLVSYYEKASNLKEGEYTGYQTAKHYYGDQRKEMLETVKALELDKFNLMGLCIKFYRKKLWKGYMKKVKKRFNRIFKNG